MTPWRRGIPPRAHGDQPMKWWTKLAIVLAGYALALLAGCASMVIYDHRFSPADQQAYGGMIAGGEMMYGGGVVALLALIPTALALWFIRTARWIWLVFAIAGLAFAIAGLAATITLLATSGHMDRSVPLMISDLLATVQMFGSPIWVAGFGLFALLAPTPALRRSMLVAVAFEVVIAVCALVHLVPAWLRS